MVHSQIVATQHTSVPDWLLSMSVRVVFSASVIHRGRVVCQLSEQCLPLVETSRILSLPLRWVLFRFVQEKQW